MQRNTIKLTKLFHKQQKHDSGFYNPTYFDRRFGPDGLEKKDLFERDKSSSRTIPSKTQDQSRDQKRRTIYEKDLPMNFKHKK